MLRPFGAAQDSQAQHERKIFNIVKASAVRLDPVERRTAGFSIVCRNQTGLGHWSNFGSGLKGLYLLGPPTAETGFEHLYAHRYNEGDAHK